MKDSPVECCEQEADIILHRQGVWGCDSSPLEAALASVLVAYFFISGLELSVMLEMSWCKHPDPCKTDIELVSPKHSPNTSTANT